MLDSNVFFRVAQMVKWCIKCVVKFQSSVVLFIYFYFLLHLFVEYIQKIKFKNVYRCFLLTH